MLATFARTCFAADDRELAEEVLTFATEAFPDSEDLIRTRAWLRSASDEAVLRHAKDRLNRDRSVAAFLELADAYASLERAEDAGQVLRNLVEEHGECGTALAWLGQLRFDRFRESLASVDGLAARDLLLRAIVADPDALKPRLLLGQLYFVVGAKEHARKTLHALTQLCPEHERAREIQNLLAHASEAASSSQEDVESQFAQVEDRMELLGTLPGEQARKVRRLEDGAAVEELERLRFELSADRAALYSTRMNQVTEAATAESEDAVGKNDSLSREATELGSFAERAAQHMDLGAATGIVIEGDDGVMVMEQRRGQGVIALLPQGHEGVDRALVSVHDALQRLLRGS